MTANSNAYIDFVEVVGAARRGVFIGDSRNIKSAIADLAMPAGVAAMIGATQASVKQPTTAAMCQLLQGVTIYNDVHAPTPDDAGNVEFALGDTVELARRGLAWVYVENDQAIVRGTRPYVRFAASVNLNTLTQLGTFRSTSDTNTGTATAAQVAVGMQFESDVAATASNVAGYAIALVSFNLPG